MGAEINRLYFHNDCGCGDEIHLADNETAQVPIDVRPLVEKALRNIFNGMAEGIDESLFKATFDALTDAAGKGFGKPNFPDPLYSYGTLLEKSTWPFAARKTAQQQAELSKLAAQYRSFGQFKKAASKIVLDYNQRWLKTEYNTAIRSGIMAERWQRIWQRRDVFPNLKYLPSRAATPREAHKALYGRIRPVNDPFWDRYYPPSAFLCQCDVEPTRDMPTDLPETLPPLHESFQNNSGKSGILLKSGQYTLPNPREDAHAINEARAHLVNYPLFVRIYESPKGGYVNQHWLHDGQNDTRDNIDTAKLLADAGYKINLLGEYNRRNANPDAEIVNHNQITDFKINTSGKYNAIQDLIRKAEKQGDHVVLVLKNTNSPNIAIDAIRGRLRFSPVIKGVWIVWKDKLYKYTRSEVFKQGIENDLK